MTAKSPSARKSVYLRVRVTKTERAQLRKWMLPNESLSDVVRRLLFGSLTGGEPPKQ